MKYGVIGLGQRVAHLVGEFAAVDPEAEFVAVADPDATRMVTLAEKGIEPVRYESAEEMMAQHDFDVLMIGTPNSMHLDHLKLALESKTPFIFTEKPVVATIPETIELARLIHKHDGKKRLMVGLVLRYSTLYKQLREAQAKGMLGEIMSIEAAEHIAPYHGSFFMRDWRRESEISGGFMLEKCCHDLDLYQGVMGARPMKIASFGGRKKYIPSRRPAAEPAYLTEMSPRWNGINDAFSGSGDLIDYQVAVVEYANGAAMTFHTNLNVPDEYRSFTVVGVDGMAEGDFVRNYLRVTSSDTSERLVEVSPGTGQAKGHYGADAEMAKDITDYLHGRSKELPLSVIDALEAGVTALAMDESRTTGRIVELEPIWDDLDKALKGES
ncbi:Gfo/Idh/MocA family protein [Pelagovum pacificum]|uniref:Gfo/Idh/MocA family oxidoreductase n=1 Tax=Pelagovum pacificum TaxID=2588711 RepID=A0A5C5GGJ1_9RHOB|nr:Gfo/Idh/MocA family oxidoreductase [Pelagovum pacificum]QQA43179.1 Gfo/Idh/MocA family oxidoreductase [Pelagovum pacificum]TNY33680.1 Gfo/Idh/MocA family oxidoreductase [Pelagovum pacificum]